MVVASDRESNLPVLSNHEIVYGHACIERSISRIIDAQDTALGSNSNEALAQIESTLPANFPACIHDSISAGLRARLPGLELPQAAAE